MIVQQSSSFVFVWLCIVLRCWLLLSLLFDEPIREPLLAATGRLGMTVAVLIETLKAVAYIYLRKLGFNGNRTRDLWVDALTTELSAMKPFMVRLAG